ncbi:fumarylacetoacetate hydrolase family protein [Metabacillus sp. GX 13764]|uniref:fumarylacetoacetate hydrolase family protein n=1 Tax=Metabacillus kandeliae TaxID=2900151 RepID=UPI001E33C1D0|nr:fumarylacetoacetate hydrolase family protein [Metabacillus kandeliae]MCD7036055.1 fumarylacetoacetate hydrolase family protein [Metabacillus kandeliae]
MKKVLARIRGTLTEAGAIDHKLFYKGKEVSLFDIGAPVQGTVYGTLLNFKGELEALADKLYQPPYKKPPESPVLYIKPRNTLAGPEAFVPFPKDAEKLQIGAALAIVIGKDAKNIKPEEAAAFIAGYTIASDISLPHSSFFRPAVKEKARDGFCPIGPWIVPSLEDPDDLRISVFVNEELRQTNKTSDLIRPVSVLLSDVSRFMTLSEGDVLLAGIAENPPLAGIHDRVRIEIEGIGSLEHAFVPETVSLKEGRL